MGALKEMLNDIIRRHIFNNETVRVDSTLQFDADVSRLEYRNVVLKWSGLRGDGMPGLELLELPDGVAPLYDGKEIRDESSWCDLLELNIGARGFPRPDGSRVPLNAHYGKLTKKRYAQQPMAARKKQRVV